MIRNFLKTIRGRVIGLFSVFTVLLFAASFYTVRYASQNAMTEEKQAKLLYVAIYQDRMLGGGGYDAILAEAGASDAAREEKIAVLNRALADRTDEIAELFPSLGVGYYSLELDAMLTYGPSAEHGSVVGGSIAADHPGRIVMSENRDMVRVGSMVRGHIMNAMHPLVREGRVIGYAWANELTSSIEQEYRTLSDRVLAIIAAFCILSLLIVVGISRGISRDVETVISGVNRMSLDITARIGPVTGELGDVARNVNRMAENIEANVEEHDARLRAEAANAAQRAFLSRMSHEMRTPMSAVIGMTRIARQTDDIVKVQQYLEKISGAADHLLGVINDVLDISKIEAGKLELSEVTFSFRGMMDQLAMVSGFKIEEKKQTLLVTIDDALPDLLVADSQRLSQVITNLLGNANKFTPEGGALGLKARLISLDDRGCRIQIEVCDNGIGISKEQQARLFQAFEQADSSISRKYGGSGLGLAISKRIIEMMRGRVWIESELGEGSRFIFEIEAGISAEQTAPDCCIVSAGRGPADGDAGYEDIFRGKTILIAEDIEINREIVIALLEPTGVEIDSAENGAEAVLLFSVAPEKYDLIFMDVQMPDTDGYEATRQIRALGLGNSATVPIIAMTANVFKDDIERCLASGMNAHVGKPLNMDEVLKQMRKWMA